MFEQASDWLPAPEQLALEAADTHIWRVRLGLPPWQVELLRASLAVHERVRADRFRFAHDRDRFIVAHAALRSILSRYLDVHPRELSFVASEYGKPELEHQPPGFALRFNLSHSHDLALVAVSQGRAVGVDVELIRGELIDTQVAERFFSPREVSTLRSLPRSEQTRAFFLCWTRKEAYIKARGEGLSHPLDQFDVTLVPGEPAALLATHLDPAEARRWSLFDLEPGGEFVGALALETAGPHHVIRLQWTSAFQAVPARV